MQNLQLNKLIFRGKGADIVRVSCPDESSTKTLKDIIKKQASDSR